MVNIDKLVNDAFFNYMQNGYLAPFHTFTMK